LTLSDLVACTSEPLTRQSIRAQLNVLGVKTGDVLLVHSSLRSLGWVCGGAEAVVQALQDAVSDSGAIIMPTHTPDNTDPANWKHPAVPESWWTTIRECTPAFDPATTPALWMGRVPETFRKFPGVVRGAHPIASFAAWGAAAAPFVMDHPLGDMFGESSPLGRLYLCGAKILLLGVGYDSCTSLHLSEVRSHAPKSHVSEGTAMIVDGRRCWVPLTIQAWDNDDFEEIGHAFESSEPVEWSRCLIGQAQVRLLPMRKLVDFGVAWMNEHRTARG
jgi:aminoglycoside 3-N-acetyltransferase